MKTKLALAFYYLAIGFLTTCALVIVVKLIFWPPCTPNGNTCVVEPWSVAGLAGTVLAVAATVLAVLGAVAVAAWWTSLNERVNDQVRKLYTDQKAEVDAQVDRLLKEQQKKVTDQLGTVQTKLQTVEGRIGTATTDIDELETLTRDVEEIVFDGLMVIGPEAMEEWARKAIANHKFPRVPAKMTESYLNMVALTLDSAEEALANDKDRLQAAEQIYQAWSSPTAADQAALDPNDILRSQFQLSFWLEHWGNNSILANKVLTAWEGTLRWFAIAKDEAADKEILRPLEKRLDHYRPRVEHLKQDYDQLREELLVLLEQINSLLENEGLIPKKKNSQLAIHTTPTT